jgi:hypothetical protein
MCYKEQRLLYMTHCQATWAGEFKRGVESISKGQSITKQQSSVIIIDLSHRHQQGPHTSSTPYHHRHPSLCPYFMAKHNSVMDDDDGMALMMYEDPPTRLRFDRPTSANTKKNLDP